MEKSPEVKSVTPEEVMGRPVIQIDEGKLEGMVIYGATCAECAEIMGISVDTITRFIERKHGITYAEWSKQKKGQIKFRLRQKQIDLALNGSIPMLIWLGKQLLDQKDEGRVEADESEAKFEKPVIRIEVQNSDGTTLQQLEQQWSDQAQLSWVEPPKVPVEETDDESD